MLSLFISVIGISEHYPHVLKNYVDKRKNLIIESLAREMGREDLMDAFEINWHTGDVSRKK